MALVFMSLRGWAGQKATGVRMIPGSRADLTDGRALLLYPRTRPVWSRLTRLLSIGKARGGKGCCIVKWADVAAHAEGVHIICDRIVDHDAMLRAI